MSTIGLKYHNEDIHYIIKKPMSPILKPPMYKSKRKAVHIECKRHTGHQTFGLAHYEAPDSKNFLKRLKPQPPPATSKPFSREDCVPCKTSRIPKQISIKRKPPINFVKENMKKVLALQPKVPVPRRVETPRGTVKDLAHLLQMIKIRESEEYGRIPKYLCLRKKRLFKEREQYQFQQPTVQEKQYKKTVQVAATVVEENVYMIDKETRQQILDGLKENWNELSKQFLKLPVMTDTWPKIKRKMCLEKEIEQLEKDIRLVETHPFIYLEGVPRIQKQSMKDTVKEPEPQQEEQSKEPEPQQEEQSKEPEPQQEKQSKEPEPQQEKQSKEPEPQQEEQSKEPEKEEEKVEAPQPVAEADEKKDEDAEIHVHNY